MPQNTPPDPQLFDTAPEPDFDRLTELAASMIGAPVALLSLVDDARQFFKSAVGLPEPWASLRGTPLSHSFCKHVVASGAALAVEDAPNHPLVRDNPAIRDLGVAAYLGEPVRLPSGAAIGSMCVIDHQPRVWTPRDRTVLQTIARSVENAIALRAATQAQRDAMNDLMAINEALSTQSAELAIARLSAENALAQQTRFFAGLSHELRTPLNGVMGGLALLEGVPDPEKQPRFRAMIRASAQALSECVEDLLTYCRLGAGIEATDAYPFDPADTVRNAGEAVRASAEQKGLTLEVLIDPATPQSWVSDGRKVEHVLVNLLGNAVKYTDAGHVRLSVRPFGAALAFRVEDSGRGVPEAHRDAIFEPFNRGDPDAARSCAGTGLGLAIARETAQRLGGSLTLERSAPGEGSAFLMIVPQGAAAEKAAAAQTSIEAARRSA